MKKIIYLVGARGSGKSTIGRKVAEYLAWTFVDTDTFIQDRAGCSISTMVEKDGWEVFREAESEALRLCTEQAQEFPTVIATGGGMVLAEKNRLLMRKQGLVFFLYVPANILVQRLTHSPESSQRPSLTEQSLQEEVQSVLAERLPLYKQCAHTVVNAALPIAQVTKKIYIAAQKQCQM